MARDRDQVVLQNFIIILVVALALVAIFVILFKTLGNTDTVNAEQYDQVVAEETRPVGEFRVPGMTNPVAAIQQTDFTNGEDEDGLETEPGQGQSVYEGLCFSCHSTNLPGIPQLGDAAVWADKTAEGNSLLYERAINGFTGSSGIAMPPKGGNPALSDDEVRAAVDYIIANSQ